ncbi:formamidopyrimidine-DNA glycosylase [Leifsonia bigeumensis]|uniref:DNA-(apurinic or apyrimidinic site) lyase n=1 Tax=Leifsonella bigeumensis TaxID=433643 RepID=A0ABP7FKH0_9MICO
MPEGHSVHRIANQFEAHFVGERVAVTSPQGRFAAGAARLDGLTMTDAQAVGKQLFLEFAEAEDAPRRWLRVHLGIYGAWDFAGDVSVDASALAAGGRIGQTGMKGVGDGTQSGAGTQGENEDSLASIGAPRRTRLRMAESEKETELSEFPSPPVGQVRVRLLTDTAVADLRGPTACEVLTPEEVAAVIATLGPDPIVDPGQASEDRFVEAVRKRRTPIGLLLMDQSVVAGIGNVYRAELLYRARLNPHTPGNVLPEDVARTLWRDWEHLLNVGVRTGQMLTMDDLDAEGYARALASRDDRHWVYRRAGLPCRTCGTHIVLELAAARKLYWCPVCQA